MKIIPTWPPRDLWRSVIHGLFGLFLGAGIGFGVYARSPFQGSPGSLTSLVIHVIIAALLFGLIAALYGDDLWENLNNLWLP